MNNTIPPRVCKALKNVVKTDLDSFDVTIHDPNKKGEGFLGEIVFVTVKDKKTGQELDLVIKQSFDNQVLRNSHRIRNIFMNEIYFYTEIWPTFNKLQKDIPSQYQFQKIPKCFGTISEDDSEQIILENLKFQKFEIHDKKKPLSKEHFKLLMREYGKFHALSFGYKALYPKNFEIMAETLEDMYSYFGEADFFSKVITDGYESALESLRPGEDDKVIEAFNGCLKVCTKLYMKSLDCETKYTVITHGDCWSNNMMFKYDETGKVTDVRFLDFQLSKLGSPCCDLSYCLYSGAPKEVLQEFDYYLGLYHHSLSDTLRELGCDPEKLYPLQALRKDWKQYSKLGLSMGLMVWKMKMTYESEIKDIHDAVNMKLDKYESPDYDRAAFRKISRDLILHLYENDFL